MQFVRGQVELAVAEFVNVARWFVLPPQERFRTREQLANAERLGDIILAPGL